MCAQRLDGTSETGGRGDRRGYLSADDLIVSLRGDDGPARHALALGYLMAIQDSAADCMEGQRLLSNLRGEQGEELRLAARGYVAAVRDDLRQAGTAGVSPEHAHQRPSIHSDSDAVRAWLERHPPRAGEMALHIVRAALRDVDARRSLPLSAWAAAGMSRMWLRMQSHLSTLSIAALAAISIAVGIRHIETAPSAETLDLRSSLELSEASSQLTALMLEERRFEKDSFINLQTQDTFTAYEGQWEGHRRRFAGLMSKVSQMKMSDQDRSTFEQIDRDFQEYTRGYEAVVAQIRTGMVQTARQANDAIGPFKSAAHRIEADSNAVRERAELRLIKTL